VSPDDITIYSLDISNLIWDKSKKDIFYTGA